MKTFKVPIKIRAIMEVELQGNMEVEAEGAKHARNLVEKMSDGNAKALAAAGNVTDIDVEHQSANDGLHEVLDGGEGRVLSIEVTDEPELQD